VGKNRSNIGGSRCRTAQDCAMSTQLFSILIDGVVGDVNSQVMD
jgi:hypothetical protein